MIVFISCVVETIFYPPFKSNTIAVDEQEKNNKQDKNNIDLAVAETMGAYTAPSVEVTVEKEAEAAAPAEVTMKKEADNGMRVRVGLGLG